MILKNAKVISPKNEINEILDIKIENGVISALGKNLGEGFDLAGKVITPGLVEMHCHLREPGFEYKETLETGIASALAGGYTAICPMANTMPVVDNLEVLGQILKKSEGIALHQVCAITKGLQGEELTDFGALKSAGAVAFSDDGKPLENMVLYKQALLSGELIISHAEDSKLLCDPLSEALSVSRELEVLRDAGGRIHFAHISTRRAIELIRHAKADGLNVTCETAPHYFIFTQNDVTENGRFKMNPPLRTEDDRQAVIEGLKDGTIDCIATDHAPHSFEEKTKPFAESPFGIVGFETALGATLTYLVNEGHLSFEQAIEKLSVNPAKILRLQDQGKVEVGQKANLAVIDQDLNYTVDAKDFKSKCKISPFEGKKLTGKAIAVVVDGNYREV